MYRSLVYAYLARPLNSSLSRVAAKPTASEGNCRSVPYTFIRVELAQVFPPSVECGKAPLKERMQKSQGKILTNPASTNSIESYRRGTWK